MKNTIFPQSLLDSAAEHYQAHLERIGDYLLPGPGVWWEKVAEGIMFLDGSNEELFKQEGPTLQHFSSTSLTDMHIYLQQQWEACCHSGVEHAYVSMAKMEI